MSLYVGTSGYSYKEWKGSFYPQQTGAKEMLPYYASLPCGGAEQHVLSSAAGERGGKLEGAGSRQIPLLSESLTNNYTLQATQRLHLANQIDVRKNVSARGSFGCRVLSAAARHEEGHQAFRDVPERSARGHTNSFSA